MQIMGLIKNGMIKYIVSRVRNRKLALKYLNSLSGPEVSSSRNLSLLNVLTNVLLTLQEKYIDKNPDYYKDILHVSLIFSTPNAVMIESIKSDGEFGGAVLPIPLSDEHILEDITGEEINFINALISELCDEYRRDITLDQARKSVKVSYKSLNMSHLGVFIGGLGIGFAIISIMLSVSFGIIQ